MVNRLPVFALLPSLLALALAAPAAAAQPQPWQMGFQPAATPVMREIEAFHDLLLVIITLITLLVLGLLVYVMIRFNEKANPTPSRTTHNAPLEVLWTAVPVIVLIVIAVPSFKLLYFMDRTENPEMTLKAIGHQWYWSYEYPDHGGFSFDSVLVPEGDLAPGQPRLLEVDNRVVLPVDTNIRLLVTAADVIHSWAVPAFGIKSDAVPGRINEAWIRIEKEGVYYGQCSELCGINHGFMPVAVEAVAKAKFQEWVKDAERKFAKAGEAPVRVAATGPAR